MVPTAPHHPPATETPWPIRVHRRCTLSDTTAPRHYELLLILEPSIDERTVPTSVDTFLNVIRNGGGTVENVDIWGKRRLAYEIRKQSEGIYVVIDVNATSEVVDELDRQLNLNESVMRTKITRPPAPKRPTAAAAAS
ncbi:30S ribosomal protein S6 [Nakamurella sp. DB0629]|uniref:Small ribosomal subunit protein bS6 n=1 Tax=Nakamurella aerolata TaxID=1656892 RepID=A0A849A8I9_9ACTN|nr:30S ribosomal protein S6 [Nakamurella aerolata]